MCVNYTHNTSRRPSSKFKPRPCSFTRALGSRHTRSTLDLHRTTCQLVISQRHHQSHQSQLMGQLTLLDLKIHYCGTTKTSSHSPRRRKKSPCQTSANGVSKCITLTIYSQSIISFLIDLIDLVSQEHLTNIPSTSCVWMFSRTFLCQMHVLLRVTEL